MDAIVCSGLRRDFGAVHAVDGLSLSVPRGAIFTLLGANGAGKTTTIHLLLGLLEPTAGSATVLGLDPRRDGDAVRARCGVLLEHHGLYERLTAEENLEVHARIARIEQPERSRRIRETLEHFGLWDRRGDAVVTWSRGMKQKLAVARATLHRPEVVFLDEPTAGLDPEAVVALRADIAALARERGATVFLNTHNLADAEKLSDLVGVMRDGKLLAVGTPDELRSRRASSVTVVANGLTDAHAAAISARDGVDGVTRGEGRLTIAFHDDVRMAPIVRELVDAGVDVEEVRKETAGLEDVFLQLMREERA